MAADSPDLYVSTIPKARRHGKILIDYLRNQRGMTAVAAYSTRSRPGAGLDAAWLGRARARNRAGPFHGPEHADAACLARADPWADFRAAAAPIEAAQEEARKKS